jgi:hypothetical protein
MGLGEVARFLMDTDDDILFSVTVHICNHEFPGLFASGYFFTYRYSIAPDTQCVWISGSEHQRFGDPVTLKVRDECGGLCHVCFRRGKTGERQEQGGKGRTQKVLV